MENVLFFANKGKFLILKQINVYTNVRNIYSFALNVIKVAQLAKFAKISLFQKIIYA